MPREYFTDADASYFQRILQAARDRARKDRGYCSEETRLALTEEFKKANDGKEPYVWQLDITEAILLGLDSLLIAGTGAGKTMPMVMGLLLPENKDKFVIIISPLNALEEDQVRPQCVVSTCAHRFCERPHAFAAWVCQRPPSIKRTTQQLCMR